MARTYLFFRPASLPLETGELSETTVLNLEDSPSLRVNLEQVLPGLAWQSQHNGQATVAGNWYEVRLPQASAETLVLWCSLRVDHSAFVQDLCNRLGWLAFDERPMCFQPHRSPIRA
jgi:hypothetical protein